jgi:signal transduction histidine kinase
MSLRTKIIFLFGLLAVVPMLVLAGFSYWHAQNLLRTSVHSQLRETAQVVGEDLEQHVAEVEAALDGLLDSILVGVNQPEDLRDSLILAALDSAKVMESPSLAAAAFIQVRDPLGPIHTTFGNLPDETDRCSANAASTIVELTKDIFQEGRHRAVTVGYWASDLILHEGHFPGQSVSVLAGPRGKVLYSEPCPTPGADSRLEPDPWLAGALASMGESGSFKYEERDQLRLGAVWLLNEGGWIAVATADPTPVTDPLNRMVVAYWVFVLGLGISTALAFSILLGRFTKSLTELARAAEEIGTGELDPWLPVPTSGEVGQLTLTLSRMLTRIRQMMTQVDQSGRLAVVGQLSAYLAHEIRNPLSSIKLNLQRLKRWTVRGELPEFCLEPLEISLREVERLSASVSGVLQLSKAQDSPREVVGLHGLVEEAAGLLASKFKRQGVELRLDLDAQADQVLARPGQMKSVILNIMVNALEAQPEGGVLEVRTELAREPEIGGPVVALHFKDQGRGIDPDVRDRVFEPFFTTKAGGSGIGLAMAFRAVRDNEGDLYLEPTISSESGAEFVVVFPLASFEPGVSMVPVEGRPLVNFRDRSPRWAVAERPAETGSDTGSRLPSHLMTPEGLEAVLALADGDTEEVN